MMKNPLQDNYGRVMKKLRVSLLDACNFRCTYCMPEDAKFSMTHQFLTPEELFRIVKNFWHLGIEEVRLTGGEPTLRYELLEIAQKLSEIKLKRLGMTTNGFALKKWLPKLKETKLQNLNISLDSLCPENFKKIAKVDGLVQVKTAIEEAVKLGFEVKINTVLTQENLHELENFLTFTQQLGSEVEIRFLELMKIGIARETFKQKFVSSLEILEILKKRYDLFKISVPHDSTAFKYKLNTGNVVGFIASESLPFCQGCSRLRLSPTGKLRACLMKEDFWDIRQVPFEEYPKILQQALPIKPFERPFDVGQAMYQIGG